VKHQYAKVVDKVYNCQISAYILCSNDEFYTLADARIFIFAKWKDDERRCCKAEVFTGYKSIIIKLIIDSKLVEEIMGEEVDFDFISGDVLYDRNVKLAWVLDKKQTLLDIHKDECIDLKEPAFSHVCKRKKGGTQRIENLISQGLTVTSSLLQFKLELQDYLPLISTRDVRLLIITLLFCTEKEMNMVIEQIGIRHRKDKPT